MKTQDFDVAALFASASTFRDRIVADGGKPGAERWTVNSHHRNQMFHEVSKEYCRRTGCKSWNFPFSVDGVVLAFLRVRKQPQATPSREEMFAPQ